MARSATLGRIYARPLTLAAALGVVAVFALCKARDPAAPPATRRITVMTYNLNVGMGWPEGTVALLRDEAADVVLLQDATAEWSRLITRELADRYAHVSFELDERGAGQGVASRLELETSSRIASAIDWFPARRVVVRSAAGPVQILSVHLKPTLYDERGLNPAELLRAGADHLREIRHFFAHVDPELPTVVVGDFNEGPNGAAVRWLVEEQGLTDALSAAGVETPTWKHDAGPLPLRAQLDHVLYSRHFACRSARVIERGGSDHFPVVAVLERVD